MEKIDLKIGCSYIGFWRKSVVFWSKKALFPRRNRFECSFFCVQPCQGDISQNVTSFTLISEYILSHNLTPPIRVFSVLATTSFSFINIYLALKTSRNNAVVDLSESKTIEKRVIKESIFKICFGKKRFLDSS